MAPLTNREWSTRFLDETPGDAQSDGPSRQVPGACWSKVTPFQAPNPKLRLWAGEVAAMLDLSQGDADVLAGGRLTSGMTPYAQRYGGHQFGNWAGQLGDGRAITLGELNASLGTFELQLKGAGHTPYSRFADGKAVLRSSVREFLCSEAMHHLGVPTTRALSLCTTGESVMRDVLYNGNKALEQGAVVCRVAPSFIRFGSFQIHTATGDHATLRALAEHTVRHHFPTHSVSNDDGIIAWANEVAESTALMIAHWMRVGFVHGVMNTDNMSIHGLTIDYGPYGWLEDYNPGWTPNTTDASNRRYRYAQQPQIGAWNLARWLESLIPLMEQPERLEAVLDHYGEVFNEHHNQMWVAKLGLGSWQESDQNLVAQLNSALQTIEIDMTIFFRLLSTLQRPTLDQLTPSFYEPLGEAEQPLGEWLGAWMVRTDGAPDQAAMKAANPKYVLRNWMAQLAIDDAEKGDYSTCEALDRLLKAPYDEQPEMEAAWFQRRPEWARNRVGCSMLSCSS
ncbi:MAG: YdiU family protein [Candidatus Poseidoniaceae archaeon]|nr:YdiU family protein [Candidatus Poseidoniaceae archaeon]